MLGSKVLVLGFGLERFLKMGANGFSNFSKKLVPNSGQDFFLRLKLCCGDYRLSKDPSFNNEGLYLRG